MSAKTRSPEDWISFLLTCMDYTPAKPDWQKIAADTGAYKSGKFVNQAYANLRKKYDPLPGSNGTTVVPATPKSTKKRAAAAADLDEDDDEKPRKSSKVKTPKKEQVKKDLSDEEVKDVKAESSADELNGVITIKDDEDESQD